jgi:hypothetical protein
VDGLNIFYLLGNVIQSSKDAAYLARHVGIRVGIPINVPAVTINRLCGSGFESIVQGGQVEIHVFRQTINLFLRSHFLLANYFW